MKYFLFLILVVGNSSSQKDKECSLNSDKHFTDSKIHHQTQNDSIIIKNFDDLNELNLNCDMKDEIRSIIFIPNKEIFFDNTFKYDRLFFTIRFKFSKSIDFIRINGFNQKSFDKVDKYFNDITFCFQKSRFDFYKNGNKIDEANCKLASFNRSYNFFGAIVNLAIGKDVYYSKKTCPYVFINTRLTHITLGGISNSLLLKNQLGFLDLNQTDDFDLNTKKIFSINLGLAFEDITTRLIDKYVFKYIKRLIITGVVESIQEDLFLNLKNLGFFYLMLENFDQFLHNSDNKWMKYINNDVTVDLKNESQINKNLQKSFKFEIYQKTSKINSFGRTFGNAYLYPDEDFCLFKYFPHEHLVYTPIISGDRLECTCTLIWLIQYIYFYDTTKFHNENSNYLIDLYYEDVLKNHSIYVCLENDLKAQIKQCNFPKRLNNCDGYQIENKYSINDFEVLYDLKWLELVIFMFLQPIICFIGIVTNFLSILTLNQKNVSNKNEKDYSMYKHMMCNSIFNLIYCFLSFLRLVNVCIFTTTIFCSSVYYYESAQYFRIIFIYYIGNVIKLCCNISYISFSLTRFALSTNTKNKTLLKFETLNLKIYYAFIVIICSFFSLFKCFQYKINEIYNTFKSFPLELLDVDNCSDDIFKCKLLRVFNLINDFILYILFFLFNMIIDVLLIKSSKKSFERKQKLVSDKNALNTASKSNKKITKSVIVTGLLFSLAYTPEFLARVLLLIFDGYLVKFCFLYYSCKNLTDLADFFTFFPIAFQFLFYKKFNKKFKEQFKILKRNIFNNFKLLKIL